MDLVWGIGIGILAARCWKGVNARTAIRRCTHDRVVLPVMSVLKWRDVEGAYERDETPPVQQEEVVLDEMVLGDGERVDLGYSERTNSLWINVKELGGIQ